MNFYTLTNDHLFKKIFTEEKYLKILLFDLFGIKVNHVSYLNPELIKSNEYQKAGIVDLLLEIDDEIVILELQNIDEHNFRERLFYYQSHIVASHCLGKSKDYCDLKKIKIYAIINYELSKQVEQTIHLKVEETNDLFLNKVEYKIFNLKKVSKDDPNSKYYEIINLFKNDNLEKLKNIIKNKEYQEILEKMEIYNQNREEYQKMEDIYKMMMEEKLSFSGVYRDALEEGISKGISKGKTLGKNTEKRKIAKNMLSKNIDINLISEITNMPIKDIQALR